VSITGSGFTFNAGPCKVFFDSQEVATCSVTPNGTIAVTIVVPADAPPGAGSRITVCNGCGLKSEERVMAKFEVTAKTPPPPPPPPPTIDPEKLRGIPGVGIGQGIYGPSNPLRLFDRRPRIPPGRFFVPRCAPPPGATVIDFDDLPAGADPSTAYSGVRLSADATPGAETRDRSATEERLEVFAPEPGTISAPNAVRWVSSGERGYGRQLVEIVFDRPQRLVGLYVGQSQSGLHGQFRLYAGAPEDSPYGPREDPRGVSDFDTVFVDSPSPITTCMLITRADGAPFDRVTLETLVYPVPELDRLFFSTSPLPVTPSDAPASAAIRVHHPREGQRFRPGEPFRVTGVVVLGRPVGGFRPGARLLDEVRVAWPDVDGFSYRTATADVGEPYLDRGLTKLEFALDGVSLPAGRQTISAVAVGPGYSVGDTVQVTVEGPRYDPRWPDAGLADFQPLGMEVTQGIVGGLRVGIPGGTLRDGTVHVAGRTTVVRLYGRVAYPEELSRPTTRPAPVGAWLYGFRGGRALPGSPLVASPPVVSLSRRERSDDALQAMRLDKAASWNFVLPSSWTAEGDILLQAVVNPADSPFFIAEAPGAGGPGLAEIQNWMFARVRFAPVRPRPIHVVIAEAHWRDREGPTQRAAPTIGEIEASLDYLYKVFPLPDGGLPLESAWLYPLQFVPCPSDPPPPSMVCQLPPPLPSPPAWDNSVLRDRYAEEIAQPRKLFVALLFSPRSPIGCSGRAGFGFPLFHAGACGATVAQEAGHTMDLKHLSNAHGEARDGTPFDTRFEGDHGQIEGEAVGWDLLAMQPVAPTVGEGHVHDYMSYGGGATWTSLYTWRNLLRAFRDADAGSRSLAARSTILAGRSRAAASEAVARPGLLLDGIEGRRGRWLLRAVPVGSLGAVEPPSGGSSRSRLLRLVVAGARGRRLLDRRFAVSPETHSLRRSFSLPLRLPAGATAVVVLEGGKELGRIEAGARSPRLVRFSARSRGGAVLLSWRAVDPDRGDEVRAFVQVERGSRWSTVIGPLAGGSARVEPSALVGLGRRGKVRIRLVASDGLHLGFSRPLAVQVASAPPAPAISGLPRSGIVTNPAALRLRAIGLGLNPGALAWYVDGRLADVGEEALLPTLRPGTHRVRLVVRGAAGRPSRQASMAIRVQADADGDGLGDTWERRYRLSPRDAADARSDRDRDGLTAFEEQAEGTDPRLADTDGDGYRDGLELAAGGDPRDRRSRPVRLHGDPTKGSLVKLPPLSSALVWAPALLLLAGGAAVLLVRRRIAD
jgi:hypothetical protein